ncbi:MAG: hypothetical protein KatS3mg056_0693 [Chloroflexus sp.]|nr:MAG: hypothetical protein KatS3mg056_0693 [Chloroflexus sp.]
MNKLPGRRRLVVPGSCLCTSGHVQYLTAVARMPPRGLEARATGNPREHLQPSLTQRDMWVMHSPAEAGLYTQGVRASSSLTACAQQSIATLNQLPPAEAIRCRWFPPPAGAGEGGGGSQTTIGRSTTMTRLLSITLALPLNVQALKPVRVPVPTHQQLAAGTLAAIRRGSDNLKDAQYHIKIKMSITCMLMGTACIYATSL